MEPRWNQSTIGQTRMRFRFLALWVSAGLVVACVFGLSSETQANATPGSKWYRTPLAHGEEEGFLWGFSASGPTNRSLKKICSTIAEISPREPGVDYVESSETTGCGELLRATDSMSIKVLLGSTEAEAKTLLGTLYPPDVRRVTYVLSSGEERSYRAKGVKVANRVAKGIPYFRYVAALFDSGSCIKRTVTYNAKGRVIKKEAAEVTCPRGA